MDKSFILKMLYEYGGFNTKAEFAFFLDITPQALANWYKRETYDKHLLINKFTDVNPNWILTGEGEMRKEKEVEPAICASSEDNVKHQQLELALVSLVNSNRDLAEVNKELVHSITRLAEDHTKLNSEIVKALQKLNEKMDNLGNGHVEGVRGAAIKVETQ